jgi:aminopeptidase N
MSFKHLSKDFTPYSYDIELSIERLLRKWTGKVVIEGEISELSEIIRLHAKSLKIKKALINKIPADVSFGENDEIELRVPKLTQKQVSIIVEFEGKITDSMVGIYPSYYQINGENKEIISTQCEPHHAREIFPCIDEPAAKATFDLTLETEKDVTVLGNMPIKSKKNNKHTQSTKFYTTPKMSTYLLAFIIGDLHNVSTKTKEDVEVNIWANKNHDLTKLDFALDVAKRSIEFFEDYFGAKYPLPKMDLVAIPDFSSGAMENWGLVTYREICLIVDPSNASISQKQQVATVIAHETSHQWFGNLVTMKWWDDLWLNESFANMMEYVAVDALFPKWQIWNEFASHESLMAKRRDSLPGVQPVKVEVQHPDEINTLFDPAIVYAKGGNLLYMLKNYLGEETFIKGLGEYFRSHAYSNTSGDDLWKALGKASGKDVGSFMKLWLEQSGFPVVSVSKDNKALTISQQHFQIGGKTDKRTWDIPLFADGLPEILDTVSLETKYTEKLAKLNSNDKGYFITKYDTELENRILESLDRLSPIDRLQILSDANLLARANQKSTADLINLLEALQNETSQPVWDIMATIIADLRRLVEDDKQSEELLKKFIEKLTSSLYRKLGWNAKSDEGENIKKLRSIIIGLQLYAESPQATAEALKLYDQAKDIADLDGELRASIIATVIKHHKKSRLIVESLLDYYKKTSSVDVQIDISIGLTATKDQEVGRLLINKLTDKSYIKPQDVPRWYAYLVRNKSQRSQSWQWLVENWSWVSENYQNDHHYDSFAYYSANSFITDSDLKNFEDFFKPKIKEIALKRTIEIGIDEIKSRIDWLHKNQKDVIKRLKEIA